jgi:hypothetical protein
VTALNAPVYLTAQTGLFGNLSLSESKSIPSLACLFANLRLQNAVVHQPTSRVQLGACGAPPLPQEAQSPLSLESSSPQA